MTAARGSSSGSPGSPEASFPISASPPSELADQTNLLDAIIDSSEQGRTIDRYMSLGVALFSQGRIIGPLVWPRLGSIDLWRQKIGTEIVGGLVPAGVLDFLMTD